MIGSVFGLVQLAFAQTAPAVLPTGAVVSAGAASISSTAAAMTIQQATDRAAINWQSFNIGKDASVNVVQPNAQSVLLNRVVGESPSQIFGRLSANGQIVLVNPNGITFGKDGSVSAAGLTASTLNISDADFMAGNMRFTRNGATGAIINQGQLRAVPGGYVALLGATVSNEGSIVTPQGNTYLAAAEAVKMPVTGSGRIKLELSPAAVAAAVSNSGSVVTGGGQVFMQASTAAGIMASVLQSGSIDTTGEQGGKVTLLADGGEIRVSGSITANSTGKNDQGQTRAGGDIVIGRDLDTNVLAAVGDVRGARLESQGGFVETSGGLLKTDDVSVKAKDWLLDPYNITIAASGVDLNNYNLPTTVTGTGSITAKTVTYAGLGVSTKTYDQSTNASLSGTAALGTVAAGSSQSTDGKVITNDDVSLSGTAVGTYLSKNVAASNNTVTFSGLSLAGGDASNYTLVQQASTNGSGTIVAKTITPTAQASDKTYDGTATATLSAALSSAGVYTGDAVTFGNTGAYFTDRHVAKDGSGNVVGKTVTVSGLSLDGTDASNYALSSTSVTTTAKITPKALTLAAVSDSKTYDGTTNSTGTVTAAALESVDTVTATQSFVSKDVLGTNGSTLQVNSGYTVNDGNSGNNYTVSTTTAAGTIAKANLTVSANNDARFVTLADAAGYNGASYSGWVNGETASVLGGTLNISRTNASTNVAAGTYAGTLVASGLTSGNYNISYANGDYTIVPANKLLISTSNVSAVYGTASTYSTTAQYLDGNNVIHTLSQTGSGNSYTFSDGVGGSVSTVLKPYTVTTGSTTAAGVSTSGNTVVGNYSVLDTSPVITGANFVGSPVYVGNLTVTPKALTATMTASNKVYDGGVTATATGSSVDIVTGDKVSFANTSATFANKNAGTGKTVTVSGISLGDADAGNYVLQNSTAGATADITPKAVTLTAGPVSKTYDGGLTYTTTSTDLGTLSSQLISGDSVSAATIRYTNKNAGTGNKAVTLDAVTLSDGNDGGNYTVTLAGNSTSTITPKALTATYTASHKVYDGNNIATVLGASSDIVGSDVVNFGNSSATFDSKHVGTSKLVTVTGIAISGADAGNYSLQNSSANTTANVTPKAVTLTAGPVSKTYDGGLTYTTTSTDLGTLSSQLISGDSVSAATISYANKNASNGNKAVTLDAVTLSDGNDGGNYTVTLAGNSTSTITPKDLTATYTASHKVYDGNNIAAVLGASSDIVGNDVVNFGNSSATFDSKHVGTSKLVTVTGIALSGADAGNYSLQNSSATTTANVTPKAVTLNAGSVSKTYDGGTSYTTQTADLTTLSSQLISGDSVSAATISYANKNAGTGNKVVTLDAVTLSDGNNGGNYNVTLAGNNTSTITQRAVTLTADTQTKTYDGTTTVGNASAYSVSTTDANTGFVGTEGVTGVSLAYTDKNAGAGNKTIAISSAVANSNTDLNNYAVTYVNNIVSEITKNTTAKVVLTANSDTKTYNGSTQSVSGYSASGTLVAEDTDGIYAGASGKDVGTYATTFSGTEQLKQNYQNVQEVNGALTITPNSAGYIYRPESQKQVDMLTRITLVGFGVGSRTGGATAGEPIKVISSPEMCTPETDNDCVCDSVDELGVDICHKPG